MPVDEVSTLIAKYSELTTLQMGGLIVILFVLWLLAQTWLNRGASKQRNLTETALLALVTRQQIHTEEFEKYIRAEDIKTALITGQSQLMLTNLTDAFKDMAKTQDAIRQLIVTQTIHSDERSNQLMMGINRAVRIGESESLPIQDLISSVASIRASLDNLIARLEGVAPAANTKEEGSHTQGG